MKQLLLALASATFIGTAAQAGTIMGTMSGTSTISSALYRLSPAQAYTVSFTFDDGSVGTVGTGAVWSGTTYSLLSASINGLDLVPLGFDKVEVFDHDLLDGFSIFGPADDGDRIQTLYARTTLDGESLSDLLSLDGLAPAPGQLSEDGLVVGTHGAVTFSELATVPLPAGLFFLAAGIGAIGLVKRRRRFA